MLLVIIALFGCATRPSTEIVIPAVSNDFYLEALQKIAKRLEQDPSNSKLAEQQLFYCKASGWPLQCDVALNVMNSANGMSESLFQDLFSYYEANDRYQDIINLAYEWRGEYSLSLTQQYTLIESLRLEGHRFEALSQLAALVAKDGRPLTHEFAATQYLAMGDTLKSIYFLSKVSKSSPNRASMITYGKLLILNGYADRGIEALENYSIGNDLDSTSIFSLVRFYEERGYNQLARKKLKPFAADEAVSYAIAVLYQKDGLLDSAIIYADSVLVGDPTSLTTLKLKGALYYQKGWLATALNYYEQVYAMDSTDTVVSNDIADIQRKIAYLQRKKFEESKAPLLELNSKKIINE